MDRHQSRSDRIIYQFDTLLRTLMPHAASSQRTNPAEGVIDGTLDDQAIQELVDQVVCVLRKNADAELRG